MILTVGTIAANLVIKGVLSEAVEVVQESLSQADDA